MKNILETNMIKISLRLLFMFIFLIISSCEENKKKLQNDTIKIAEKELKTSTDTIHYSSSPKKIDFKRNDQNEVVLIDGKNRCKFNHESISFEGFAKVQARCLLRPVKKYGHIDKQLAKLPAPLDTLIGKLVKIDIKKLRRYLETRQISETDMGGSLDKPLSKANNNKEDAPHAKYFVIHDTSTPLFENQDVFPDNINEPSWKHNNLERWLEGIPKAHVFISRTGNSVSPVHFEEPWRATKFELKVLGNLGKGLFLHIELIQPRRKDLNGIDAYSPDPGFSKSQLDRLALVYLAASLRRGEWLIPAYHAVLDQGFVNAHDDPQNFNITEWAASIADLLETIEIN